MAGRRQPEIPQPQPFSSLEEAVVLNVRLTADALVRGEAALLKKVDLSPAQYDVLRILRGARPGGLKCRDIGDHMVTRDPDVTRLLDRMERRGLIARERQSRDRRVVETKITPAGLKLLKSLDAPMTALCRRLLAHMERPALENLNGLLEKARGSS